MWEGHCPSMPSQSAPLSQHLHKFTDPEALQTHPLGVLWRLHYIGIRLNYIGLIELLAIGD